MYTLRIIVVAAIVSCHPFLAVGNELKVVPREVRLDSSDSRQQLIVASTSGGFVFDVTRNVAFESANPRVASVDKSGVVRPAGRGRTQIRVTGFGETATVSVSVGDLSKTRRVSFTNDVMAVIGRAGCNAGACHGHGKGKGGFKLSLRGYDLAADFQAITDSSSGRVETGDPSESLILQMPTEQLDHGGGKRFDVDSAAYRTLSRWIAEGATICSSGNCSAN